MQKIKGNPGQLFGRFEFTLIELLVVTARFSGDVLKSIKV